MSAAALQTLTLAAQQQVGCKRVSGCMSVWTPKLRSDTRHVNLPASQMCW